MKKGILRLAIVLSILAATVLPVALMEKQPWVSCTMMMEEIVADDVRVRTYYESQWIGETGHTKLGKLTIMISPVEMVRICRTIDKQNGPVGEYPAGTVLKKDGSTEPFSFLLKKGIGFFPVRETLKERLNFKQDIFFDSKDWDERLGIIDVKDHINWAHFFKVATIGFCSVWTLYLIVRWVFIAYIIEGFKNKKEVS